MILKMLAAGKRGLSDEVVRPAPLKSEPAVHCTIIDFEAAKRAMDQAGKPEQQRWPGARDFRQLPNLAAEDWFEWTAL